MILTFRTASYITAKDLKKQYPELEKFNFKERPEIVNWRQDTLVEINTLEELIELNQILDERLILDFCDYSPDMEEQGDILIYDDYIE